MSKKSIIASIVVLLFVLGDLYFYSNRSQKIPNTAAMPEKKQLETLAQFPHGTWLENGVFGKNGTLYFTSYFEKKIYAYTKEHGPKTFATLPFYPVAILPASKGFLVTAHGVPFTQGASVTTSNQIALISSEGKVVQTIPAPQAKFLNGMTQLPNGKYLIADSLGATLWLFDPQDTSLIPWLQDDTLAPDPGAKGFALGANGMKLAGNTLFISNTSQGTIVSLPIENLSPKGKPAIFAKTGSIDDFTVAKNGNIYATSHGPSLLQISPKGAVTDVMKSGCDGCAAVFFDPADTTEKHLIFLTTGNFFEEKKTPAKIIRLQVN